MLEFEGIIKDGKTILADRLIDLCWDMNKISWEMKKINEDIYQKHAGQLLNAAEMVKQWAQSIYEELYRDEQETKIIRQALEAE